MVKLKIDHSVQDFLDQAGPFLYQDEAQYSLMLGLCEDLAISQMKSAQPPVLVRILENGSTVAAAAQLPPNNLIVTQTAGSHVSELAKCLRRIGADFPGVVGPARAAEAFADEWCKLTPALARMAMGQKIYKLEAVQFPSGVAGEMRPATAQDTELLAEWVMAFTRESLGKAEHKSKEQALSAARRWTGSKASYFWCVEGRPVSMTTTSRPTRHGISLIGVFTPIAERGRGYASALVAHVSQKMLDDGRRFCVLYTDLANPTSNKIYQRIGYQEVAESKYFAFDKRL